MVLAQVAAGAAVQCPGNICEGWASNSEGQIAYAQFHPTLENANNWQVVSPWIADPSKPPNVGYGLFSTYAATQGLDPNKAYKVNAWYQGFTLNIEVPGTQVEVVPSGYVEDPFTFMHNGDTSYLDLWSLFGAGHYVDGANGGYHVDAFGVLNPLHYADFLAGWITGPGPTMTFTCQVNTGCH